MKFYRATLYGTCSMRAGVWAENEDAAYSLFRSGRYFDSNEPEIHWDGGVEDIAEIEGYES